MTTLVALGRLLRPVEITGQNHLPVLSIYREHGIVPKASRQDNYNKTPDDLSRYLKVSPGDLVVNKMKAWSGSVAVSAHEGIVSGDYLVCRVTGPLLPPYLHYVVRSSPFVGEMRARSTGIRPNQERLYWDDLSSIAIEVPSIVEQRRIADFLDDQTTRIDNIIGARQKQIGLGDEEIRSHRAELMSVAARGVTVLPLSRLSVTGVVSIARGKVISKEDLAATPGDFPVYSSARENDGAIGAYGQYMFDEELVTWSVDGGGHVFYRPAHKFSVTNICAFCRVLRADLLDTHYLGIAMQDQHSKFSFDWQDKAHPGVVRDLYLIALPSLSYQRELVSRLSERAGAVARGLEGLSASIALLQEFKRSLISAAVSGEFDVSTASGRGIPA